MSKTWEDALRGLVIVSAAIVDDTTFVFTANWDETYKGPNPPRKYHDRAVFCDLKAGTWGGTQFDRFSFARCAAGPSADKQKQALFADGISQVMSFTFPDGPREAEGFMPIRAAANLFFAGQHFYAYGLGNAFLRRNGPDDWTILSEATGDRATQRKAGNITAGNGYSDNDIYLWNSGPLDADDPMDKSAICCIGTASNCRPSLSRHSCRMTYHGHLSAPTTSAARLTAACSYRAGMAN